MDGVTCQIHFYIQLLFKVVALFDGHSRFLTQQDISMLRNPHLLFIMVRFCVQ